MDILETITKICGCFTIIVASIACLIVVIGLAILIFRER